MRRRWSLFMAGLALVTGAGGCGSADRKDPVGTLDIALSVLVCPAEEASPSCVLVRVPNADVEIMDPANGTSLWDGETDDFGRAEARTTVVGDVVVVASSPLLVDDLELPVSAPQPGTTVSVDLTIPGHYVIFPFVPGVSDDAS